MDLADEVGWRTQASRQQSDCQHSGPRPAPVRTAAVVKILRTIRGPRCALVVAQMLAVTVRQHQGYFKFLCKG